MKKIFTIFGIMAAFSSLHAQIVINEVYGGGGNSGATLKNDFIELKNIGAATATLSGATLQYAAATGTFNQYHTLPDITLNPGQTYLIQEAAGAGGTTNLPTPDFTATTVINFNGTTNNSVGLAMSGTAGKIVLASNNTQVANPTDANVVDFVGFGATANQYEGSGAAPAPSNTNSVSRVSGDTNNNATDFVAGSPTPKNSAGAGLAVSDVNFVKFNFVKNTLVKEDMTFGERAKDVKIYNMLGQVVKSFSVQENDVVNASELGKGHYIVTGTVNNTPVSQRIVKD